MNNVFNNVPFLRTSRGFPEEIHQLALEVNKTYVDIANAVNNRTISLFPTNRPVINGENWFINNNQRQQGFRQVYNVTPTVTIPHGINVAEISRFTNMYGVYTDGTNWYGLIAGTPIAIPGQLSFYVSPTNIVFVPGAGVPGLVSGTVVLEWIVLP